MGTLLVGTAYHELAQMFDQMPRHYKLKHRIAELNSQWDILPTPPGTTGVQQKLKDRLEFCVQNMIKGTSPEARFMKEQEIRVKLTGDGTNIGKRLHVVTFGFTILDEGDKAYSAAGNHILAVFKEPEDYSSMKTCLADIREQVENLDKITVNDPTFSIKYYLGGDWKYLAMLTGIQSASSNFTCIWCKCPVADRANMDKKWSAIDTKQGARTIEENCSLAQSSCSKFGVATPPLFPSIPLTRVVVDNLHMFLRVADVLIDLLILELRQLDKVDKVTRVARLESLMHLACFEKKVKEIGISGFSFWIGRESKKLKWRSFTGPEKLKIFGQFNLQVCFPEIEDIEQVQKLWTEFIDVNKCLSTRPDSITPSHAANFEKKARDFVKHFADIYPSKHVTPYMHCMVNHVSDFMSLHGSILPFTQQGLEKYNDVLTKDFFQASSHKGIDCLKQLLQKQNRLELLEANGAKRKKKHDITCQICKQPGHNRLTCTNPCPHCSIGCYCSHLTLQGTTKVPSCLCDQEN